MKKWCPRRDYEHKETDLGILYKTLWKKLWNMKQEIINQKEYTLLSCQTKAILLGSILGDGSLKISKNCKNAHFQEKHSIKQKEYLMWKRNKICQELSASEKDIVETIDKTPNGKEIHKIRYGSGRRQSLTHLHTIVYKNSVNGYYKIRRTWLNQLTPLSLAVWWCDDGSLVANTRQGVFCTDGFTLEDMKILDRYMKKVWNINTSIHSLNKLKKDGTQRYRLWIRSREDLKKFLTIIIPFIPVYSMLYKVLLLWKDPELQQRWISHVEEHSIFTKDQILQVIEQRKHSLKHFISHYVI